MFRKAIFKAFYLNNGIMGFLIISISNILNMSSGGFSALI